MSKKYVINSGFLTICSCEIDIFMLLQLWNQVLHLRLVTSYPLAPSSSRIVHLIDIRQTFFVFLLQICERIPRHRQALCHVDNSFIFLLFSSLPLLVYLQGGGQQTLAPAHVVNSTKHCQPPIICILIKETT